MILERDCVAFFCRLEAFLLFEVSFVAAAESGSGVRFVCFIASLLGRQSSGALFLSILATMGGLYNILVATGCLSMMSALFFSSSTITLTLQKRHSKSYLLPFSLFLLYFSCDVSHVVQGPTTRPSSCMVSRPGTLTPPTRRRQRQGSSRWSKETSTPSST